MEHERLEPIDDRDELIESGRKGGIVEATTAPPMPVVQPYALDWKRVFAAGALGTLAMGVLSYLWPLIGGPPLMLAGLLGSLVTDIPSGQAFWAGMLWLVANGIVWTLLYASVLLGMRRQSDMVSGVVFGVVVWLVAMLVVPMLAAAHPAAQIGRIEPPGVFLLAMGAGLLPALLELVSHLAFGTVAGRVYRHRERETVVDNRR